MQDSSSRKKRKIVNTSLMGFEDFSALMREHISGGPRPLNEAKYSFKQSAALKSLRNYKYLNVLKASVLALKHSRHSDSKYSQTDFKQSIL